MNRSNLASVCPLKQEQQQPPAQASEKGKTVKKAKTLLVRLVALSLLILLLSAVCSASAVWT